jgi:hypothetical protein
VLVGCYDSLCYTFSVITFLLAIWLQNQLQSLVTVRFVEEEILNFIQNAWWAKFMFVHTEHCFRVSLPRDIFSVIYLSSVASILNVVHYW